MSAFRSWWRARAEGLACLGAGTVLVPALAAACCLGIARGSGRTTIRLGARTLKRWLKLVIYGFDWLREVWWGEFAYERPWSMWRYLAWIELFNLANLAGGTRAGRGAEKILVVKLAHFGDALHIVPFLRALKAQRPTSTIDLLVGPWCESLAGKIPYIDRWIAFSPSLEIFNRGDQSRCRGAMQELAFLINLRRAGYTLMVSTSVTHIIEVVLLHAVAPERWIGADHEMPLYEGPGRGSNVPYETRRYEAERIGSLMSLLGGDAPAPQLEYWITEKDGLASAELLDLRGVPAEKPYVVVAPGAGWSGKLWPAERFAELADELAARRGVAIVLAGSRAERDLAADVAGRMKTPAANVAGETSLDQLAAMLKGAALFVGNDSAPMHLAAAVGTRTLSFFGPTRPEQWAPRGVRHRHLAARTPCEGCHPWHQRAMCLHDRRCMKEITTADAVAAAMDLLQIETESGRSHLCPR